MPEDTATRSLTDFGTELLSYGTKQLPKFVHTATGCMGMLTMTTGLTND